MRYELPSDKKLASEMLAAQTKHEDIRLNRGWIGALIGSGSDKPWNIATCVIFLAFVGIFITAALMPRDQVPFKELITLFAGTITTAIGFTFGRRTSDDS